MDNRPSSTIELEFALRLLGTGPGVVVAGLCVVLFLLSFLPRGRWLVICLMLYTSMFGSPDTQSAHVLISPFDQLRYVAQPLTMLFLVFLLVPALFSGGGARGKGLLGATLAFWLVEVVFGLHVMLSADFIRGSLAIIIYTTILAAMGYGLARWLRAVDDVHAAIRCIAWAGLLFVASTSVQLIINRHAVIFSNRLYAITGNPQHAALMLAICLLPVAFLFTSRRESVAMRVVWGAVAGLTVVMLIWTGSRTGALSATVGLGLTFRRRLGKFILAGIVVAALVFGLLATFQVVENSGSRLFSTLDTRSETWRAQFDTFKANPLVGKMAPGDWGPSENSYLTVASRTGLAGLFFLAIFLVLVVVAVRRVGRLREMLKLPEDKDLVDVATAGLLAILAGSVLEGILVGTLTFMLLSVYFYLGLIKFLTDSISAQQVGPTDLYAEEGGHNEEHWRHDPAAAEPTLGALPPGDDAFASPY